MEKKKTKILVIDDDKPYIDRKLLELGISEKFDVLTVEEERVKEVGLNKNKLPLVLSIASMFSSDSAIPMYYPSGYYKYERGIYKAIRNSKEDPKIQRNSLCPCGSGKKYKYCCITKN